MVVALSVARQRISRACYLLRTFNPTGMEHGTTEGAAALAKWSGNSVERLIEGMEDMIVGRPGAARCWHGMIDEIAHDLDQVLGITSNVIVNEFIEGTPIRSCEREADG